MVNNCMENVRINSNIIFQNCINAIVIQRKTIVRKFQFQKHVSNFIKFFLNVALIEVLKFSWLEYVALKIYQKR